MKEPSYDYAILNDNLRFEFNSIGENTISKMVIFQEIDFENFFQIALVDVLENGTFDDKIISDNGDRNKILATVFQIISHFLNIYPESTVLFTGSTPSRTRLYQIAISSELEKASELFNVQGFHNSSFESFSKGINYEAFSISKNKSRLQNENNGY